MLPFKTILTLFLFVAILTVRNVVAQDEDLKDCRSTLFRLIGTTNAYLWVCRCVRGDRRVAFGRATYVLPKWAEKSNAKHKAFVNCQNQRRSQLEHTCFNNRDHYESRAEEAMKACAPAKYQGSEEERKIQSPFVLKKGKCFAEFVGLFSATQTNGLWACVCKQKYVEIVVARAQFSSKSAPGSEADEVRELEDCTKGLKPELSRVCLNVPGDFQLLALQNLQTCCKRARVLSNAKFECAAFVPSDVSVLKPLGLDIQ